MTKKVSREKGDGRVLLFHGNSAAMKALERQGWKELPGAMHMGRGMWLFRVLPPEVSE